MPRPLNDDIAAVGGSCRRDYLLARGHGAKTISEAVKAGTLVAPRRGWVAAPNAPTDALRAVVLGGVLGGASALDSYGIWVDVEPLGVVVSCARTASRLPALAEHERRVWLPATGHRWLPWRVSVVDALLQYALDAPRDSLIAAVDSALNKKLLPQSEYHRLLAALPARSRTIATEVDRKAMSGTETRMRLLLVRAGYRVRTQVKIPTIGIVDIVVEDWLILELDSKKHHDGETNQFRDRTRDGNSVLGQYGHERFMWSHVFYNPEWCLNVVEARVRERAAFNMLAPSQ